jgi:hypothetical protein
MPRIDPTVTKEAEKIYKSWQQGERGQKVSQAIIDYDNKGGRLEQIEARLAEVERRIK